MRPRRQEDKIAHGMRRPLFRPINSQIQLSVKSQHTRVHDLLPVPLINPGRVTPPRTYQRIIDVGQNLSPEFTFAILGLARIECHMIVLHTSLALNVIEYVLSDNVGFDIVVDEFVHAPIITLGIHERFELAEGIEFGIENDILHTVLCSNVGGQFQGLQCVQHDDPGMDGEMRYPVEGKELNQFGPVLVFETPMILDLIKNEPELGIANEIIQNPGFGLFQGGEYLPLIPYDEVFVEPVVDGGGYVRLVEVGETIVDAFLEIFDWHTGLAEPYEGCGGRAPFQNDGSAHFESVYVAIPDVHGVAAEYDAEGAEVGVPDAECEGRVFGEEEGCGEEDGEDGPESVFEFLGVVDVVGFVEEEDAEGVEEGCHAGPEYGCHGE
jgi:hypothetical protein